MKKKTIFVVAAAAVLVMAAAMFFGRWAGRSIADETKGRLSLLWPDIMEMPQQDRALLALLAYECRLPDRPKGRTATIECLRSAVGAERMKKVSPDPAAHLDKLLGRARPETSNSVQG